MTYQETLTWLFAKLPMYQRQGKTAFKKDLTNIRAFSEYLDNPQRAFKSVHVAGTNGKGSTAHIIASILQESGNKTGLYTSPHLRDFRERIKINGNCIPENDVVDFVTVHRDFIEEQGLSYFELTVGMAFWYFAREKVDIAVVEVGLGGRLDSTNIITPLVSVITNIGLDHTQMLGDTYEQIAAEKAGIIKPNIPVVLGHRQKEVFSVFNQKAKELNAPLYIASEAITEHYRSDLKGGYQQYNIKTAVKTIALLEKEGFKITDSQLKKGVQNVVKNTGLLGRWQQLGEKPLIICDTAHNKEGLQLVIRQILNQDYQKLHIVLGVVNDKKLDGILPLFPREARYYFCKPDIPRGLAAGVLRAEAETYGLIGNVYNSVPLALQAAKTQASNKDFIFVGGSTFVVAEVV